MSNWNPSEVRATGAKPDDGKYTLRIEDADEVSAADSKFGLRYLDFRARIEGGDLDGKPYNFNLVIGMKSETAAKFGLAQGDPDAQLGETWAASPQAQLYVNLLEQTETPKVGNTEQELSALEGKLVIATLKTKKDKNGVDRQNISYFESVSRIAPSQATNNGNARAARTTTHPVSSQVFE